MTERQKSAPGSPAGKHFPFWRSSVYDEPTWVSLAWILVPILLACLAIYSVLG